MARLFNSRDSHDNGKKDSSGFWSTAAVIGVAILGAMAEAGNKEMEYNDALNTLETVVPRYEKTRNTLISTFDWNRMKKAEEVFEACSRTKDGAAENASRVHAVLIANQCVGDLYKKPAKTREGVVEMDSDEAQSIWNIYTNKYVPWGNETVILSNAEKEALCRAAVVLRKKGLSVRAGQLERLLARAL